MDRLDRAIEDFFDETSELSFSEKFSNLRQAYMWNAIHAMKLIQKNGKKHPRSEDEDYKQVEGMKQFRNLEKMYMAELKANKIEGKNSEELDKEWIRKIKESNSSLGSIVRSMNEKTA